MEFYLILLLILGGLAVWLIRRSNQDRTAVQLLKFRVDQLQELVLKMRSEQVGREPADPAEAEPGSTEMPAPVGWRPIGLFVGATGQPNQATDHLDATEWQRAAEVSSESGPKAPTEPGSASTPLPAKPVHHESTPPPAPPLFPRPTFNWEQFVGVRLFAWLGGLALFFAAALGLKYSFEHNLVPPAVRATGGFLLGVGLLVGGVILRRREYAVTSQTLCATGVVILYAVTFACRAFYHFAFFGLGPTFLLMVLITATAFFLAVRMEAQVVAVLGMLGGFLTPVMLSTGEDNPLALFGYLALLDLGLIAVVRRKRWDYLVLLAMVGTVLMQLGWYAKFFEEEQILVAQRVFLGMPLLFVGAFAWAVRKDWLNRSVTVAAFVPPLVALGISFALMFTGNLATRAGALFTVVFGADLLLLLMVALRPQLRQLEAVGGALVFALLSLWTIGKLSGALLYWAFGLYLGFAILHTLFPLALQRLRPKETPPAPTWSQFFPALALMMLLLPLARELTVPWLFWLVVLGVDALAVVLAAMAGAVAGLVAVLVLTLGVASVWIAEATVQDVQLSDGLVVICLAAVFFFGAGAFLWRRMGRGLTASGEAQVAPIVQLLGIEARQLVPSLSASLPFLLLVMVAVKFRPANPSAVFGVAALLLGLLLALVRMARMEGLLALGLGSIALLQLTWLSAALDPQQALIPLLWQVGFYAVFLVFPFVWAKEYRDRQVPWIVSALAGPIQFALVLLLMRRAYPNPVMGLVPAAFAVPSLLALAHLARSLPAEAPRRLEQLAWFGGVSLFFITIIFPIQFDRQWITLAWALEGAALCGLFRRLPHPGLPALGVTLLCVAFVRLALNPAVLSYHPRSATPIFNWYLYSYGVAIGCLFAAAWFLKPADYRLQGIKVIPVLQGLGTVLAFLLVNIEIADFFSAGGTLTFEFSGNFGRDMTYTIAWALFAFGLLVIGIRRRAALVRYSALALLSVALLKLFLHDLARLNQLYRIGAFAVVAVIAIVASFLYQRFLASDTSVRTPPPRDIHS